VTNYHNLTEQQRAHKRERDNATSKRRRWHSTGDHSLCAVENCTYLAHTIEQAMTKRGQQDNELSGHYNGIIREITEEPDKSIVGSNCMARCHFCRYVIYTPTKWATDRWWIDKRHYCLRGTIVRVRWAKSN